MKVAFYSPRPPERSGISDYAALLLPALRAHVEVEVARRGYDPEADVALYHVGNDADHHGWIVDALRRRPGVVVLHDFVLHHLVARMTLGRGDGTGYVHAMERGHGLAGRLLALGVLRDRLPPLWDTRGEDYPLAGEVLDAATGVVVHSHHVEALVRETGYGGPLARIPHPAWRPPDVAPERREGVLTIGCFGALNETKRLPELLAALELLPDARLLLVGGTTARYEPPPLPAGVERIDRVDEQRLWALMRGADVHVSLRFPTMGETSGSVVRSLSLGKPLVVSDVGWFSELPDDVALKVPVGDREAQLVAGAIELAAAHRDELGAAARAYAERELDLDRVAGLYVGALAPAAVAA